MQKRNKKKNKPGYRKASIPRYSRERIWSLLNNILDKIAILDAEGIIYYVSPSFKELLGYRPQELITRRIFEFIHPDDAANFTNALTRAIRNPGTNFSVELRFRNKDASWHILKVAGRGLFDRLAGRNVVIEAHDISECRVIEEKFKDSQTQLELILEKVEDGITVSDESGYFYVYNSVMEKITGYSMEEANAYSNFLELICPDPMEKKRAYAGIEELLAKGTSRKGELTIVGKGGRSARIIVTSYLILHGGRRMFLSIYRDISEHKQLEEALRAREFAEAASRAKSEFLTNMSHELRTPLNSIIGFSEVLYDETFGPLNEKQKEYANYILSSGRYLLSLINDILDLSKIETGKMELKPSVFSLKSLLEGSLVLVKEMAFRQGVEVSLEIAKGIDRINADERKVKEIVYNLLSNAVKFTPRGGKVGIRARNAGSFIEIAVWDTGIGIEPQNRERIFSGFFQLDDKYEGAGLGLLIAKKLVELHAGKIWVESEGADKGSTFKFTLPIRHWPVNRLP